MDTNSKNIQLQYEGYFNTPLLWQNSKLFSIKQLELPIETISSFSSEILKNEPLGKRVERFVTHQLSTYNHLRILAKNIQIQNNTLTVGEIDFLIEINNIPIHLEVVYKFYLFDPLSGTNSLEHWIGPNRKDSLLEKITKLKNKQLPLIYSPFTKPLLQKLNINVEEIKQQVLFKAQLFVPLSELNNSFESVNNNCIKGFYIHFTLITQFSTCKFYIPSKINWLLEPQVHTNWIPFNIFSQKIIDFVVNKTSPLCWLKKENGELETFFVTWWK